MAELNSVRKALFPTRVALGTREHEAADQRRLCTAGGCNQGPSGQVAFILTGY